MKVLKTKRITFANTDPVALSTVTGARRVVGFALYAPPENIERVFFKFSEDNNTVPILGTMDLTNSATIAPDHSFPVEMTRGDGGMPASQLFDMRHAYVRGAVGDAVEIYYHDIREDAA